MVATGGRLPESLPDRLTGGAAHFRPTVAAFDVAGIIGSGRHTVATACPRDIPESIPRTVAAFRCSPESLTGGAARTVAARLALPDRSPAGIIGSGRHTVATACRNFRTADRRERLRGVPAARTLPANGRTVAESGGAFDGGGNPARTACDWRGTGGRFRHGRTVAAFDGGESGGAAFDGGGRFRRRGAFDVRRNPAAHGRHGLPACHSRIYRSAERRVG